MAESLSYAAAGVDIDKASDLVRRIKEISKRTPRTGVMGEIGGFGGLYSLNVTHVDQPVLVSATDGVGTKLKIARMMDRHDTVGIDLVAMCVNDVIVQGAKPLFFLDYLSMGSLDTRIATELIEGIAEGCSQARCALIGGETAEMPGYYPEGEYDLAGFAVGLVDNAKIIDGSDIRVGHQLVGIPSSGIHSNGFSLVRKICFDVKQLQIDDVVPELGRSIGEELLTPTRIYSEIVAHLIRDLPIHALAHITGGGIAENILRVIPDSCNIVLHRNSWTIPPIFRFLQDAGGVSDAEMFRTFNNGIGMIAIVPDRSAADVIQRLEAMGETAAVIGEIVDRRAGRERIQWTS